MRRERALGEREICWERGEKREKSESEEKNRLSRISVRACVSYRRVPMALYITV